LEGKLLGVLSVLARGKKKYSRRVAKNEEKIKRQPVLNNQKALAMNHIL